MIDNFNVDTDALRSRIGINTSKAIYDLEEWIIPQLPPLRGLQVLDLGCGTGKQVFRIAPLVSHEGRILGVDLSENSVRRVNECATAENLSWVEAQQMDFDDYFNCTSRSCFDLIISSYAIDYSQDIVALLKGLRSLLTDRGVIFICGYGKGTNCEIHDIVNSSVPSTSDQLKPIDDFLDSAQIQEIAGAYSYFTVSRLENQILFNATHEILSWWRCHNSFVPSVASRVAEFFHAYFEKKNTFSLTKNVLAVRFNA